MAGYRKPFEHRQGQGAPAGSPSYEKPRRYLFELMKKHKDLPLEKARECLLALGIKKQGLFEEFLGEVDRKQTRVFMGKIGGRCIARFIENGGRNAAEIINRLGGIKIGEFIRMAAHVAPEIGATEAGKFVGNCDIEKVEGFLKDFGGGASGLVVYVAGGENMAKFLDEVGVEKAVGYARKEKIGGAREIRNNFAVAVERAKAMAAG